MVESYKPVIDTDGAVTFEAARKPATGTALGAFIELAQQRDRWAHK